MGLCAKRIIFFGVKLAKTPDLSCNVPISAYFTTNVAADRQTDRQTDVVLVLHTRNMPCITDVVLKV